MCLAIKKFVFERLFANINLSFIYEQTKNIC